MSNNRLRNRLAEGRIILGTWVLLNSIEVAEITAWMGFDFILFDLEHGTIDLLALEAMCQAVASTGTPTLSIARVPWNDPVFIKRALEVGVSGLVIPMVRTAEEAHAAVAATRYPPGGVRGVGDGRANRWSLRYAEYLSQANDDILVVVQCEHIDAVSNIEDIVRVPGIDAILIGPDDLAASLGRRGQTSDPQVQDAFWRAANACLKSDVPPGQAMMDAAGVNERIEQGFRFLTLSTDYWALVEGYRKALAGLRPEGDAGR